MDYLFHDLLPRGGFSPTFNFIRDRSRAVRSDFTMQHITGPLAIECHDRCVRFHILALHFQRDLSGFSIPLEEQQLMNSEFPPSFIVGGIDYRRYSSSKSQRILRGSKGQISIAN